MSCRQKFSKDLSVLKAWFGIVQGRIRKTSAALTSSVEHWIVVQHCRVTIDQEIKTITEKVCVCHLAIHMENLEQNPMVLIDSDLSGEDDIIRYDDVYKRN